MTSLVVLLHVTASLVFLGTILSTYVWRVLADRTENFEIIHFSLNAAIRIDRRITGPSAILITLTGFALMFSGNETFRSAWLLISLILWFVCSGLALAYLVPTLDKLELMAAKLRENGSVDADFTLLLRKWNRTALFLVVVPFLILILMVLKVP